MNCPTAALRERDDVGKALEAVEDKDIITVVQIAPAIRTVWGESMGLSKEEATVNKLADGLKKIGFDYVFDTANPEADAFKNVRGRDGWKEAEFEIAGTPMKVAVVSGLGNTRKLMDAIKRGDVVYRPRRVEDAKISNKTSDSNYR